MAAQVDASRRKALFARSRMLRASANTLMQRLQSAHLRDLAARSILSHLDDVESFYLGDPDHRPQDPGNEEFWLDSAEIPLSTAAENLRKLHDLLARYGPSH